MKKSALVFLLLLYMPVFGVCPIGGGENVCTLPDSNSSTPLFQMQNTNYGENVNNFSQPSDLNSSFKENFNKNKVDINSSLGCQFGNCNQGLNNSFLKNNE